jgi:hypothetical protein
LQNTFREDGGIIYSMFKKVFFLFFCHIGRRKIVGKKRYSTFLHTNVVKKFFAKNLQNGKNAVELLCACVLACDYMASRLIYKLEFIVSKREYT